MNERAAAPNAPPEPPIQPLEKVAPKRVPWWSLQQHGRTAWSVHLVLLAIFAVLAAIAHSLRADRLDVWITNQIQQMHVFDALFVAISWIGYTPQEVPIFGALIALVIAFGYRVEGIFLLISVLGSAILGEVVKDLVARPRPSAPVVHVLGHLGGYSFPSGHVLAYVSLFGFLVYMVWIEARNPAVRWAVLAPCAILLVLVGPSRIYLGAHWASDVVGAYFLGGIWLSAVLRTYVAWLAHSKVRRSHA